MKTNILFRILTLLLAGVVVILPGCRNYLVPEQGTLSKESARINFSRDGGEELWKGNDLDIKYSITEKNGELQVYGTIMIHDSIILSFDRLEQLVVKLNLLDKMGRVIETVDITPFFATYNSVAEALDFKASFASVPEASSFAFSYFGTLYGGKLTETSDSWEIFYFPFLDER